MASTPVAAQRPDLVVLAFPFPGGTWMLSTVYPGKESKERAEDRVQRLLKIAQWEGKDLKFEERALEQTGKEWGVEAPVMSSITFSTTGALVSGEGTLALEPFLLAFRDLETIHLTVAVPQGFTYMGVQQFADNRVAFSCKAGEGAISCMAKIKDHSIERLDLPQFQSQVTEQTVSSKGNAQSANTPLIIGFALMASLAAGVGVFLLVRRFLVR
jgi:hypothetical protein